MSTKGPSQPIIHNQALKLRYRSYCKRPAFLSHIKHAIWTASPQPLVRGIDQLAVFPLD